MAVLVMIRTNDVYIHMNCYVFAHMTVSGVNAHATNITSAPAA